VAKRFCLARTLARAGDYAPCVPGCHAQTMSERPLCSPSGKRLDNYSPSGKQLGDYSPYRKQLGDYQCGRGLGFRVQGSGFRVQGSGFRV